MALINCEVNLIFTWSEKCVLSNDTKATTFAISGTKLLEQLRSGFKRQLTRIKINQKFQQEYKINI